MPHPTDRSTAPDRPPFLTQAVAFVLWLFGAAAIGWGIAFAHVAFGFIVVTRVPDRVSIPATVAVFASYLLASAIGGVLLSLLSRWALRRARCTSLAVALTYALVSTFLALYAMCHASWFAGYIQWFTQGRYTHLFGPLLGCIFSLLLGGFVWLYAILTSATHDPVGRAFLLVLLLAAIYYSALVFWTAIRTVRANRLLSVPTTTSAHSIPSA